MSDSTFLPDGLSLFYTQLIKSPLPLSHRNNLGDILASVYRSLHTDKWRTILASKPSLTQPLANLRDLGFLPISIPFADQIVSDLLSLDSSVLPENGPGGRTETVTLKNVDTLPSVQKLINDKTLYNLVSLYLGAPAHLHTCQAWWQHPMGPEHKPSNAQLWHRDRDDLSELKLFFYGSDVDHTCGPHAFIPKSHTHSGLCDLFPLESLHDPVINGTNNSFVDDSFFIGHCKDIEFKTWIGSAGTCFLEDTRGFHRAYIPTNTSRLIFSLVWTIGPGF